MSAMALGHSQAEGSSPDASELQYLEAAAAGISELGQPERTRELYERVLRIQEREFGPAAPQVATTLVNLGRAWHELGQPERARELHERALRIQEPEFGPAAPQVA